MKTRHSIALAILLTLSVGCAGLSGDRDGSGPQAWIDAPRMGDQLAAGSAYEIVTHGNSSSGMAGADIQVDPIDGIEASEAFHIDLDESQLGRPLATLRHSWTPPGAGVYRITAHWFDVNGSAGPDTWVEVSVADGLETLPIQPTAAETLVTGPTPTATFTPAFTPTFTPTAVPSETPVLLGSISGTVWNDLNNNGSLDGGEPGLADVTVNRFSGACGGGFGFPNPTTTDGSGNYSFQGLEPGTYCITVPITDLPSTTHGWDPTGPDFPENATPSTEVDLGAGENRSADFGFEEITIS